MDGQWGGVALGHVYDAGRSHDDWPRCSVRNGRKTRTVKNPHAWPHRGSNPRVLRFPWRRPVASDLRTFFSLPRVNLGGLFPLSFRIASALSPSSGDATDRFYAFELSCAIRRVSA